MSIEEQIETNETEAGELQTKAALENDRTAAAEARALELQTEHATLEKGNATMRAKIDTLRKEIDVANAREQAALLKGRMMKLDAIPGIDAEERAAFLDLAAESPVLFESFLKQRIGLGGTSRGSAE